MYKTLDNAKVCIYILLTWSSISAAREASPALVRLQLSTTVPPVADIVCSAGSLLQCHVRRHCHAKIKAKIGCYAILHATFADYIRLNISHHILLFDSEKWMNK